MATIGCYDTSLNNYQHTLRICHKSEGLNSTTAEVLKRQTQFTVQNQFSPIVSFSGPLGAHMDCSKGWKSLKQKPSFFDGLSMTWQVFRRTVPTQWLL